jgi:hypothetical protein
LRNVDHDGVDASHRACLGDTVAHRSGADDAYVIDRLHPLPALSFEAGIMPW